MVSGVELIDAGGDIKDGVLALLIEEHGDIAVLQVGVDQDDTRVFIVKCDSEIGRDRRAARAALGAVHGHDLAFQQTNGGQRSTGPTAGAASGKAGLLVLVALHTRHFATPAHGRDELIPHGRLCEKIACAGEHGLAHVVLIALHR